MFKKHYNDSPEVLVSANHSTSGGNLNPLYNSISAWAEVRYEYFLNRSGVKGILSGCDIKRRHFRPFLTKL